MKVQNWHNNPSVYPPLGRSWIVTICALHVFFNELTERSVYYHNIKSKYTMLSWYLWYSSLCTHKHTAEHYRSSKKGHMVKENYRQFKPLSVSKRPIGVYTFAYWENEIMFNRKNDFALEALRAKITSMICSFLRHEKMFYILYVYRQPFTDYWYWTCEIGIFTIDDNVKK